VSSGEVESLAIFEERGKMSQLFHLRQEFLLKSRKGIAPPTGGFRKGKKREGSHHQRRREGWGGLPLTFIREAWRNPITPIFAGKSLF